ncbi:MAG: hypothetical protein ACKVP4_02225 [Hyphomicrobium sp.]
MRVIGSLIGTAALVVIELALTMLVYVGLNLYNMDLFGQLVRHAGGVLDFMAGFVESTFAGSADSAYASVFGELGPKSMLLLLIGLVVAGIVRLLGSLVRAARRDV